MTPQEQDALYHFTQKLADEYATATEKFPAPNPNLAALTEEVGELAQAILHIREGKANDWQRVVEEAIQVATMAARCAIEGGGSMLTEPTNMKIRSHPLAFEIWNSEYQQSNALGYTYGILKGKWPQGPFIADASVCGQSFWMVYCQTEHAAIKAANKHFQSQFAKWLEETPKC